MRPGVHRSVRARVLRQPAGARRRQHRRHRRHRLRRGRRVHRHARAVLRRALARRRLRRRRLRCAPDRAESDRRLRRPGRRRRGRHGHDRRPAAARPGPGHRHRPRRRHRAVGAVPLPDRHHRRHDRRHAAGAVRFDLHDDHRHHPGCGRTRRGVARRHRADLPAAAAQHRQPRYRRGARCAGPAGRRAVHAGPGRLGRALLAGHRRHPVDCPADRPRRHRAAPDQAGCRCARRRLPDRRARDLARRAPGLRQLLLGIQPPRLARQLLRRRRHLRHLPCLRPGGQERPRSARKERACSRAS